MKQLTIILVSLLFINNSVVWQEAVPSDSSNNWGIGSTTGFFLMLDKFIPHSFIGIEYKIK